MEQKLFDLSDLFESRLRWWEAAIVRGADTFIRLPRPRRSSHQGLQKPKTPNPFRPPYIDGETDPRWVYNRDGDISVAKRDAVYEGREVVVRTAAREKIVSDLARLIKVLVPPVQIWECKGPRGTTEYFSVSYRILTDARDCPPDDVLMSDDSLATAAILDEWTHNTDRKPNSIICGTLPYAEILDRGPPVREPAENSSKPKVMMFVDHGLSLLEAPSTLPSLDWYCWDRKVRDYVRRVLTFSTTAREVLTNIEHVSDQKMCDIVTRLPNQLFMAGHGKQDMIDGLKRSQDTVRTRVSESFALTA